MIGQKVNMAARLMMKFPNAVVCDETTHAKSGLGPSQFSLEPPVDLKGITNPEKIYRFLTERYVIVKHYVVIVHNIFFKFQPSYTGQAAQ